MGDIYFKKNIKIMKLNHTLENLNMKIDAYSINIK